MQKKLNKIEIQYELAYGSELTDEQIIGICDIEKHRIRARTERACAEHQGIPPHFVAMMETEKQFAGYRFN